MNFEGELPQSWATARLDEVCSINERSFSPLPTAYDMPVHFVPMAAVREEFGGIDLATKRPLGEVIKGYTAFVEGDVLFAKITPCMENGKLALVPKLADHVGFGSTEFHVLRSGEAVLAAWIARYVSQLAFRRAARHDMSGSAGQLRVQTPWLAAVTVPVAPLAEQQRILQRVDETLSEIDGGVLELEAAKRKLARYRQSLLKSAVEGTLTAEWRRANRSVETGEDLRSRLIRERLARWEARQLARFNAQSKTPRKDWRERYDPGPPPETADLPALPAGWVYASIGQCFEVAVGATPSRKAADYWGSGIPWVSSGEVSFGRIASTRESITESGLANSSTQINPKGSVLLGMIGEGKTRGQVAILDIPAANNQNSAAIWVSETDVPPEFVYFWLWSRYDETRRGSSGNNQPALNKSLVQAMPLPIAPIEEMREIAARLTVQFDGIAAQEREIDRLLRMASAQRQNILRAAFSGQLVPQDPNDEPACVLLERIRAQRQPLSSLPARARRPRRAAC